MTELARQKITSVPQLQYKAMPLAKGNTASMAALTDRMARQKRNHTTDDHQQGAIKNAQAITNAYRTTLQMQARWALPTQEPIKCL